MYRDGQLDPSVTCVLQLTHQVDQLRAVPGEGRRLEVFRLVRDVVPKLGSILWEKLEHSSSTSPGKLPIAED